MIREADQCAVHGFKTHKYSTSSFVHGAVGFKAVYVNCGANAGADCLSRVKRGYWYGDGCWRELTLQGGHAIRRIPCVHHMRRV